MSISLDDFKKNCQTGDLLLYSTSLWYSKIIEYMTGSKFSHIAIILKDPIYIDPSLKGIYILESGFENKPDPINNDKKCGVQIAPIDDIINSYKNSWMGSLYYRKLDYSRPTNFNNNIKNICADIYGKPYDFNIIDWIKAEFNIKFGNEKKTNTFWCSALVAYVYKQLGLIKDDISWTIISPKEFSFYEDNKSIKFYDCILEPEKYIKLS